MAWTTPPTFYSGTVVTASNLNILSTDLSFLKVGYDGSTFSGVKVQRSSAQSIPNSTYTDIPWDTSTFNVGSWWSTGATLTVPASAIPSGFTTVALLIIGAIRYVVNGTGGRSVWVIQNGTSVDGTSTSAINGDYTYIPLSSIITAAAGDTIKLQTVQSSGGALNMDNAKVTVVRFAPVS